MPPRTSTTRGKAAAVPAAPVAGISTSFRPQAAELAPALIAQHMVNNAAGRLALQKQLSEILANYRDRLRASGGPQNDVARAAAYLVASSHQVYHDRGMMPRSQFDALRRQLERAFQSNPVFQRKSDRDRQIEFEAYAIMGSVIDISSTAYKQANDNKGLQDVKQLAKAHFESMMGLPPERVRFSDQGAQVLAGR